MPNLVQKLFDGLLDLVGDVHGEIDALRLLMARLGYDECGRHPEGRRLVFLGDLVDRGPDSPAVVRLVRQLVESGVAQCVLGNHELNLIDGERKEGNLWFFGEEELISTSSTAFFPSLLLLKDEEREDMLAFFRSLPLALERQDIRVVHACWNNNLITAARGCTLEQLATSTELGAEEKEGKKRHAALASQLKNRSTRPHFDITVARYLETIQMSNPLKVLTSGPERVLASGEPAFCGGKWRFVERDDWWEKYDEIPVVVGHYWRTTKASKNASKSSETKFIPPTGWWGLGKVYCVDFSVGKRYLERLRGESSAPKGALGALRWPEGDVVFDDEKSSTKHPKEKETH